MVLIIDTENLNENQTADKIIKIVKLKSYN